jgi:glycosyltransferase involved in cell wall biosynthesis
LPPIMGAACFWIQTAQGRSQMGQDRSKILLLDSGKEWGGGTNSMLELLKRIDREKFEISCCFYNDYSRDNGETISQILNSLNIPVFFIPQVKQPAWAKITKEVLRTLFFFSSHLRQKAIYSVDKVWRINPNIRKIHSLLELGQFDILYMNNQPSSNVEGYYSTAGLPTAIVQHCRIEPVLNRDVVRIVNKFCHSIISVSQGVQEQLLKRGVRSELCFTVFNGIDINQPLPDGANIRKELGATDETFIFGSIGSLINRKAHHFTLLALDKFNRAFPEAKWMMVFVGEGPNLRRLIQQAASLNMMDKVVFTGFQSNALEYLSAFDAFILGSKSEGLPRVVLESMLLETPVIGSNVTGTAELVKNAETGMLFEYGDVEMLFNHMKTLYLNEHLRNEIAQQANANVRDKFAIEKYVSGVETVLSSVKKKQG